MSDGPNMNAIIARNLKFLREEQGLSVEDLAKLTHIGHSTINEIELNKKKRPINPDYIPLFAKALRVDPDVLTESNEKIIAKLHSLRSLLGKKDFGAETEQLANELVKDTEERGPFERAVSLTLYADLLYNKGRYKTAIEKYQQAQPFALASGSAEQAHLVRHGLASALLVMGELDVACTLINLDLTENTDPWMRSKDFFSLGLLYDKQRMRESAAISFLQALAEAEKISPIRLDFIGRCFQALGDVYRSQKKFDQSLENSKRALSIAMEAKDALGAVYAQKTIAQTLFDQGERQLARAEFLKSLDMAEPLSAFRTIEISQIQFCIECCDKNYEEMKRGVELLEKEDLSKRDLAGFYKETAQVAMSLGYFEEGQMFFLKALHLVDI